MLGSITDIFNQKRTGGTETDGGRAVESEPTADVPPERDLVEQLVTSLKAGDVSEEQRSVLRDHLVADVPNRVGIRIDHLQAKVGQLEAYTQAIEEFVDEEGTARELLSAVRESIDHANEQIDALDARIESAERAGTTLANELAAVDGRLADLDEFVETLEGRHSREIAGVDAKVERAEERLDESIATVSADVEDLKVDISALSAIEEELSSLSAEVDALSDVPDEVAANRGRIESLEALPETVASIRERLSSLEDLAADVRDLEDEFAELRTVSADAEELRAVETRVESLEGIRPTIDEMSDDLDDLLTFRSRLADSVSPPARTSTSD